MTKRNRWASMLLFVLLCVMCVFMGGCQPTPQTSEPEKVKDGIGIELVIDEKREILVADYITANGNNVETSVDKENITVELENGKITMTAVALGDCVLTISCGEVEVSFNVSVKAKKFSVTVDGAVVGNYEQGSEYELPAYVGTLDENHEFLGWIVDGDDENLKQAADKITVQANVAITAKIERKAAVLVKASDEAILTVGSEENGELTVNVADYITTYGRDITVESSASDIATATLQDGALTITAVAQGNASVSIACGDLIAMISITVNPATVLPTIESGSIAIDLFKQTSGAYTPTVVNPMPMALSYTLAGENDKASVDANGTVSYNADVVETVVLTVNVIAINPFDNEPYELSFTVEVVVSDTTPNAPTFEDKSLSYDLYTTQDGVALDGSVLKAEDEHFTYVYTVDGNEIDASHKFAQTAKVDVAYTYKGNTEKSGSTSFTVTVTSEDTTPTIIQDAIVAESVVDVFNKPTVDLSANVTNLTNVKGYKVNGETSNIQEGIFHVADNGYDETATTVTFTITVINTKDEEIAYTYTVEIINTEKYRVQNGGFESGNTDGWSVTDGMGNVIDAAEYWEGIAYQKEGNYFFHGHENKGEGTFVLQSESFTVGGSGWITFQMGAAAHFEHQYVEVVNKADDSVLARVTNVLFADNGGFNGDANMVSGLTLMKYKLDLSSAFGKEVYIRVVDTWAKDGFGMILFDNLVSYVPNAESILVDYVDATAACFADVAAQIDLKDGNAATVAPSVKSQGLLSLGYTYEGVVADGASGLTVNGLHITASKSGVYKVNYKVKHEEKEIATFLAEITVSNTTEMPKFENVEKTFEPSDWSMDEVKEVALPEDGERFAYSFSASAGTIEGRTLSYAPMAAGEVVITVTVSLADKNYTVEDLETITFTVSLIFKEDGIMLPNETPADEHYDVFSLENKEYLTVNFASEKYITVPASKVDSTVYSATLSIDGGEAESVQLLDNSYAIALANLTDVATQYTFVVTAVCGEERVSYTLNVHVLDSTAYRLVNGGFEDGLEGWTKVGNIGGVSSDANYWVGDANSAGGYAFGMDGANMFSAYAPGAEESAVGTLTSSTFRVGGSGFITFKLGAMKDGNYVYVDVVDAESKQILVRYYNGLWAEYTGDVKSGCTLVAYKADLSSLKGREVFFRISDNANSGYGLFFADSFHTYYESEPEGFNNAIAVDYEISGTIYDVFNGGFETGDNRGWWNDGEPGAVTGADAFFSGVAYGKNGAYLYSGVEDYQAGNGREGNRGALQSSTFEIGGIGYISFMLGGGGNELCYVQVIDAVTGEILARYHQQAMEDAVLKQYVADLSAYIGRTARIQVVDMAENNWGCVSFDNVITYYANAGSLPEGITANDIKGSLKYTIENGSFESGLDGWTMNITEAGAHNTLGWVLNTEINTDWYAKNDDTKDGEFLFTFAQPDGTNCENTKGTLQSSIFSLKQGAFVAFKFGGAGGGQNHDVYVELCRADGSVIARFYNDAAGKVNTRMNAYYYQYQGVEVNCFFRVVDNSTSDYGCFVVDDFRVNLESAPEGFIKA